MNNVWTTEDLNTLRTQLMLRRDLHAVAATLERPVSEVEEMARDRCSHRRKARVGELACAHHGAQ